MRAGSAVLGRRVGGSTGTNLWGAFGLIAQMRAAGRTGSVVTLKYLLRKGFDAEIESSTTETRGSINWRKEK